jgi:hypothetical protein
MAVEALFGATVPLLLPPFIRCTNFTSHVGNVTGVMEATVTTDGGLVTRRVDLDATAEQRRSIWQDVVVRTTPLTDKWRPEYCGPLYAFGELYGLDDHFSTERSMADHEHYQLSAEDLRGISNILGKKYERVTVYRVPTDMFDGWDYPIPVVFAERSGVVTDSTRMSAGELWVHYLLWFLRNREKGSLALIDEPESHISARGQRALVDEIARHCLRSDLQLIIATHSPEIVSRLPLTNIRMCVNVANKIRVIIPTSISQLHDTVGVRHAIKGVVLVEDRAAATVLKSILSILDISLTRELEIVPAGGKAGVLAGLRSMQSAERFLVAGVLDGDQRDAASGLPGIQYLPGTRSPECELLDLDDACRTSLGETLGRTLTDIDIAISNAGTLDHQYQIGRLAEELGLPEPVLWHSLVNVWMNGPEIRLVAADLVDKLRTMLDHR